MELKFQDFRVYILHGVVAIRLYASLSHQICICDSVILIFTCDLKPKYSIPSSFCDLFYLKDRRICIFMCISCDCF